MSCGGKKLLYDDEGGKIPLPADIFLRVEDPKSNSGHQLIVRDAV